jgi:hypothetical protein
LENLDNAQYSSAGERRNDYILRINESVALLRHLLPPEELDRLRRRQVPCGPDRAGRCFRGWLVCGR